MNPRSLQALSVLLIFLSLAGCAQQRHAQEPVKADAQTKTQEEPAKAGMPTFTYRPGA